MERKNVKVKVEKPDRVIDEKGDHVGTVLNKGFMKKEIYCFICDKTVSSLKHYAEQH
jgi:hypothetical protein